MPIKKPIKKAFMMLACFIFFASCNNSWPVSDESSFGIIVKAKNEFIYELKVFALQGL